MPIKNLPAHLKPREKAQKEGFEHLSEIELLAIIIRSGTKSKDALDLSKELIKTFGNIKSLLNAPYESLLKIKGIGPVKALELMALKHLFFLFNYSGVPEKINSSVDAVYFAHSKISDFNKEVFIVLFLDKANNLLFSENMYKGSVSGLSLSPREIVSSAIQKNSPKIYCIHNHPSGDVRPSKMDITTTKQLSYMCELLGVVLVNHIVINSKKDYQLISW